MPEPPRTRSRRSHSWPLRSQLVVAIVVSVAVFGAVAALLTARSYHSDRAAAGRQLARLAGAAATSLDTQVGQAEDLLASIAVQEPITALDRDRCGLVLGGFRGLGPGLLVLVDADGSILCSSRPVPPAAAPKPYAGAVWLGEAQRARAPVHAEPLVDPLTGRPSLVLAVPVPAPSGAAVLAGVLDLDSFALDLVGPLEQDRGTVVGALDAGGTTVLFRHPGNFAGRTVSGRDQGATLFQTKGLDGVERVYRAVTAPQLRWRVFAGTPVSMAFAPARRTVTQSILLTAVFFAMLALLALLLSRRLVRPTRALADAIVAARSAPDTSTAPEEGPAEIARVAEEFNALQLERAAQESARRAADSALADRVAELADAREELQRALVRFTEVQEDERRGIAQAVHDETIQALIATMWALDDLASEDMSPRARAVVERVRGNLFDAVGAARSLLFELRPPALDELGLAAAVEQQLQRLGHDTGMATEFDCNAKGRLPVHLETLAFRTTQEALRNIRQHASAGEARVSIRHHDDRLEVEIEDDGVGVRPGDLLGDGPSHSGIVAMRETITMVGGRFSIGPGPAGGTLVRFSVPLVGTPRSA